MIASATNLLQSVGFALALAVPSAWAALSAPTVSTETSDTSVTVSWTPVSGATGYTLYYAPYPSQSPVGQMNMGDRTSFSQSLPEGKAYYVAVQAYSKSDSGVLSNIVSFEIGSDSNSGGGSAACTYYVSSDGSDSASGSSNAPWSTLQHAADTVQPGDTVCIAEGQYAGFRATTSGSTSGIITFKSNDGAMVTINQSGADNEFDHIELAGDGISHWTLEGVHITGSGRYGLSVFGTSSAKASDITLRDLTITNSGKSGMYLEFVDNALVEGCTIGDSGYNGIHFKADGDYAVIRENVLYDNVGGIQVNGAADFGGDGMMSGATISNNLLFGNNHDGTGGAIGLDGVDSSTISNNDLLDNQYIGIDIYEMDGGDANTGNDFTGNTVVMPKGSDWAVRIACVNCENNTFTGNSIYHADSSKGVIKLPVPWMELNSDNNAVTDRFSVDGGSTLIDLATWQSYGFDTASTLLSAAPSAAGTQCTELDGTYRYELFETDGDYWGYGSLVFDGGTMTSRSFDSGCGDLDILSTEVTLDSDTCHYSINQVARCTHTDTYNQYQWELVSVDDGVRFAGTAEAGPYDGVNTTATGASTKNWILFGSRQ